MLVTIWLCIKYAWQNSVTNFKFTTLKLWNSWIIKFTCLGVLSQMSYGPWHCALYSLSLIQCKLVDDTIPEFMNTNHFQRLVDKNVSQWTLTRKYLTLIFVGLPFHRVDLLHCMQHARKVMTMLLTCSFRLGLMWIRRPRWGGVQYRVCCGHGYTPLLQQHLLCTSYMYLSTFSTSDMYWFNLWAFTGQLSHAGGNKFFRGWSNYFRKISSLGNQFHLQVWLVEPSQKLEVGIQVW